MALACGRWTTLMCLVSCILLAGCATSSRCGGSTVAQTEVTGFLNKCITVDGKKVRYVVYIPFKYTPKKEWPLVLFLHGAGERGADGLIQSEVGIGSAIRRHPNWFPGIVVMPQCPKDVFWDTATPTIEAVLSQTMKEYHIDPQRQYLTGLSMGGYGTWIWGATQTERFAALMPICGGGSLKLIHDILGTHGPDGFGTLEERVTRLATVPIWAFHGADDSVVPVQQSRDMVERVRAAGGDVQYTEFPKTDHNSWDQAYGTKKAIKWLFKQQKDK